MQRGLGDERLADCGDLSVAGAVDPLDDGEGARAVLGAGDLGQGWAFLSGWTDEKGASGAELLRKGAEKVGVTK